MTHVVVHDASCLIDLRKGRLLGAVLRLPFRIVVPFPIRASELLDVTDDEWRELDEGGLETCDLGGEEVSRAYGYRSENPALSANDCFCLVTTERFEGGVLLTGDRQLRRVAERLRLRAHGVLWMHDRLAEAGAAPAAQLLAALEIWRDDPAVFLPDEFLAERLARLR